MHDNSDPESPQLVVIGASAGGVEALAKLAATLPADFPGPVVIAQHLDPSRVSHLQEILSRHAKLHVQTISDRTPLRAGTIYVVPANQHVEVTDHSVGLRPATLGSPKPSVDLLLSTAAAVFGERLIAVILTGTGSDGADGAWHVKEAGGTVIIQDPRTASFPGMPLALAPTTVDIVADLETIGPLLSDLMAGSYTPQTIDEDRRMRMLLEQLRSASGIDFSSYRQPTIQRRLRRRMIDTGTQKLDDYLRYLRRHPEEYQRLASSFLIKVTDFFRDPELFDYLREQILPSMLEVAQADGSELRVWSAGCATGEEAYTLAIVFAELLGQNLPSTRVRIFATDLDTEAVAFARRGIYPAAALKLLRPEQRERYFSQCESGYEVKQFLRRLVVFGQHDLGQRSPFPRIDLVLCRNVLIYFTPELQRRALQLFAFALQPGGRLVLGKSETSSPLSEYFVLEHPRLKVYRRQGDRILIPPVRIRQAAALPDESSRPRQTPSERDIQFTHAPRQHSGRLATLAEAALLNLPLGVVVVDRSYDVQMINSAARRLLEIHASAVGADLIHLVADRLPADLLRLAIDRAFRRQSSTEQFEVRSLSTRPGSVLSLEINCQPQETGQSHEPVELVSILIVDRSVPAPEQTDAIAVAEPQLHQDLRVLADRLRQAAATPGADGLPAVLDEGVASLLAIAEQVERLGTLAKQLDLARHELLVANHELTASNEELLRQNDELQVVQQETEAVTEEVETLNEEQQATNEELETLNEELQATVEELNTTNDDLEARQDELRELADSLEAERSRLAAILAGMADAVLVVDRAGNTILTNTAFDELFGEDGLQPLDERGRALAVSKLPHRRAARGDAFRVEFSARTSDGNRRRFEARVQPTQTSEPQGILVIREISS